MFTKRPREVPRASRTLRGVLVVVLVVVVVVSLARPVLSSPLIYSAEVAGKVWGVLRRVIGRAQCIASACGTP